MNSISRKIRQLVRKRGFDVIRHKELPEWLDLHQVDIVLDIGANDGRYAMELREAGWNGPITSIEPQPAAYKRLCEQFRTDSLWTGHQLGLGSQDAVLKMNIHEMDVLSSFLTKFETLDNSTTIAVEVKRAEGILNGLLAGNSRPFVKIDTQGFEIEVIKGFGARIKDVSL